MPSPTTDAEALDSPTSPAHRQVRPATLARVRVVSRRLKLVWVGKNPYCGHLIEPVGSNVVMVVIDVVCANILVDSKNSDNISDKQVTFSLRILILLRGRKGW